MQVRISEADTLRLGDMLLSDRISCVGSLVSGLA